MPKVLHVISGLKVGGAEMFLHRLILNSRGENLPMLLLLCILKAKCGKGLLMLVSSLLFSTLGGPQY